MIRRSALVFAPAVLLALSLAGCTYNLPPLSNDFERLPTTLSRTGLYADPALKLMAADVRAYRPNYELWSDGAAKRRWIRLPQGTRIDTSNMDDWSFPVGTQLWKEFTRAGKRVETRLLQRVRQTPDGWAAAAYLWDADQREAHLTADGESDALETSHDVPEARTCAGCHAGRGSFVLGFSALQLSRVASPESHTRDLTLADLTAAGSLTDSPTGEISLPGSDHTREALGYLHANCGNCHNSTRPTTARYVVPHSALDLWLSTSTLTDPTATTVYRTALPDFVTPGQPEASALWRRMQGPGFMHMKRRMPPIATEYRDAHGSLLVSNWISEMR